MTYISVLGQYHFIQVCKTTYWPPYKSLSYLLQVSRYFIGQLMTRADRIYFIPGQEVVTSLTHIWSESRCYFPFYSVAIFVYNVRTLSVCRILRCRFDMLLFVYFVQSHTKTSRRWILKLTIQWKHTNLNWMEITLMIAKLESILNVHEHVRESCLSVVFVDLSSI